MEIRFSPDSEFVKDFKKKLKQNGGYCPCKLVKNKDTKCMCKEFRDQVARNEPGFCYCGLYQAI